MSGVSRRSEIEQRDADRRRRNRREPRREDHAHAVDRFDVRVMIAARDEHADAMPARGLRFGKHLDVILDAADDGEVVFVDVEDFHANIAGAG